MVFNIFSKRSQRENNAPNDVYQYNTIPHDVRIQIVHLWRRCIGDGSEYTKSRSSYFKICNILREEYGVFHLYKTDTYTSGLDELVNFFISEKKIDKCLDVIELTMFAVKEGQVDSYSHNSQDVFDTLNARLREASVGYQYENGFIIKIDHQFVHTEIVKPALKYLSDPAFKGASEEFLLAHQNYRAGNFKTCLVECLKAFESTMKIICKTRGWVPEGDTASKLISSLMSNNLVPPYLQTQFTSLKSVLESGIPTIRNKTAGHGQGDQIQQVPEHLASYVLHQTASAILFIVSAHKALR